MAPATIAMTMPLTTVEAKMKIPPATGRVVMGAAGAASSPG
jgi:hypothetical protein